MVVLLLSCSPQNELISSLLVSYSFTPDTFKPVLFHISLCPLLYVCVLFPSSTSFFSFPVIYPHLTLSFIPAFLLSSFPHFLCPLLVWPSLFHHFFSYVHSLLSYFFIHSPPLSFSPSAWAENFFFHFLCVITSSSPLFLFSFSVIPLLFFFVHSSPPPLLLSPPFFLPHTRTHSLSLFHPLFFSCRSFLP